MMASAMNHGGEQVKLLFGNGVSGNIRFVTRGICRGMWITFITIPSSMVWFKIYVNGLGQPITVMFWKSGTVMSISYR